MDTVIENDNSSQSLVTNRYSLVVLAAKRARQIKEGAPLLIDTESTNPLTIALEEIAAGKINYIEAPIVEDDESGSHSLLTNDHVPDPSVLALINNSVTDAEFTPSVSLIDEADGDGLLDTDNDVLNDDAVTGDEEE